jgi:hypothetical protein
MKELTKQMPKLLTGAWRQSKQWCFLGQMNKKEALLLYLGKRVRKSKPVLSFFR